MQMDLMVDRVACKVEFLHFLVEPPGMPRVQVAVIEPYVGKFMEQSVRHQRGVIGEVTVIETDFMFKQKG
jgi:hypothetical protein